MASKHSILVFFMLSLNPFLQAQENKDLGSTQPFMIGLKGTIYRFVFPHQYQFGVGMKVGYTPEIEKTTPIGYVYTQTLNIQEHDLNVPFPGVPKEIKNFAIIYTGKFETKDSTIYEFSLNSDDGSRLWIDSTEVINHDDVHQFDITKKGKIGLTKGFHNIKVWYFQGLPTRMGLFLCMKQQSEKIWKPFDLKPLEDETKKILQTKNGVVTAKLDNKMLFDVGQYTLKAPTESQFSAIVKLLMFNPNAKVRVEGHTDNGGSAKSNQLLSENRAKAVETYIKSLGIPETIVFDTKGFGITKPIADNVTETGRSMNRRVEIFIDTQ